MVKNQNSSYLYAGLSILFWATVASAFKISLRHFDFISLLFFSILSSFLTLLVVVIAKGKLKTCFSFTRKQYLYSAVLGLLTPTLYYLILFKAYSLLPAQLAQPLNFTWPLVLVILSATINKTKLKLISIFALVLSFIGVTFIASEGAWITLEIRSPDGVGLALSSSFIWALYWIFNARDGRSPEVKLFLNFLFATIFAGIIYVYYPEKTHVNLYGIFGSIYVGIFEMGLTFVFWLKAVEYAEDTAKTGNLIYLTPFFSLLVISLVLKEQIYVTSIAGLAIIVAGILLQQKVDKNQGRKKMKKMNHWNLKSILAVFMLAILAFSCSKEEDNEQDEITIVNNEIFNLFEGVYLWYNELPENVDPATYDTPQKLVDAIKFDEKDRFSSVIPKRQFEQYFQQGQSFGHGFSVGEGPNLNIRIAFVYKGTQAHSEGVRRSYIVKEVNGTQATGDNYFDLLGPSDEQVTNEFVFQQPDGTEMEISLTKEVIEINTVLHDEIIEQDGLKIGYIVFQDFISTAFEDIDNVFNNFKENNIDELIIDLRYNGGGSIGVAEHIADWILGNQYVGEPFYTLSHNDKRQNRDTTANVESIPNAFTFSRVAIITTHNTASASEMLLNGFKPYLNATSIGSTTFGKPVGQEPFVFRDYDYAVLPITFKYVNANGKGEFFDGIPADVGAEDDITKMFGDQEETSLKAALHYLTTGEMIQPKRAEAKSKLLVPENGEGIYQFLRTY